MTFVEQELLGRLIELDEKVRSMAGVNPKPNLIPLFTEIDTLALRLPSEADRTLLHYLHKRSYEKARLLLQDCDAENAIGFCRH